MNVIELGNRSAWPAAVRIGLNYVPGGGFQVESDTTVGGEGCTVEYKELAFGRRCGDLAMALTANAQRCDVMDDTDGEMQKDSRKGVTTVGCKEREGYNGGTAARQHDDDDYE